MTHAEPEREIGQRRIVIDSLRKQYGDRTVVDGVSADIHSAK